MVIHYLFLISQRKKTTEGFDGSLILEGGASSPMAGSPLLSIVNDPYDEFYAKVYDHLFQGDDRARFEAQDLQRVLLSLWQPADVKVLDIGCGSGAEVEAIRQSQFAVIGMDNSPAMISRAQQRFPECEFTVGDARRLDVWQPSSFSHAVLSYFTVYYFEDKDALFKNLAVWIKPGGGLALHLVNKYKFDPLIESASPFPAFSLQRYSKKRITNSEVVFDKFAYEGNFELNTADENKAIFKEVFKFNDGRPSRIQEHVLYMPTIKQIVDMVEKAGFRFKTATDLVIIGYEYQYIFYFGR